MVGRGGAVECMERGGSSGNRVTLVTSAALSNAPGEIQQAIHGCVGM